MSLANRLHEPISTTIFVPTESFTVARPPSSRSAVPWATAFILTLWSLLLFFHGLGAGELYRTETLRAMVASEMLRTGNWVVPTLYGEPLLTKPPGMYTAIALASLPFGTVTEVSARLPSALAATATVLLMSWWFTRQLGRRAGLVIGLLTPVSLMWLDKVPSAEIDMVQVAWVTASLVFAFRAIEDDAGAFWWLAALVCVAGGVLTKWTAPVFFYGTVIPLLWWRGRLGLLLGRGHLLGAIVGAGLCFAWAALAIGQVGWEVFHTTVRNEAVQHLLPGYHHKVLAWWRTPIQPLVALAASLPCAAFALLTLRPGFARSCDERSRQVLQALHCWAWPNLLFWSWCVSRSVRHGLPMAPALAGLAALVWLSWLCNPCRSGSRRPLYGLIALLSVWLAVRVVFVEAVIPARMAGRDARAKGELMAAAVPAGEPLYLFRLKDDGLLFYYGRPARRLPGPGDLPSEGDVFCILADAEWRQRDPMLLAKPVLRFQDTQGDPIVLVRVSGRGPP